jgi:hypothetical protein
MDLVPMCWVLSAVHMYTISLAHTAVTRCRVPQLPQCKETYTPIYLLSLIYHPEFCMLLLPILSLKLHLPSDTEQHGSVLYLGISYVGRGVGRFFCPVHNNIENGLNILSQF